MKLVHKSRNYEIWAQFDHSSKVYELFFDKEGESYTGWNADSLQDAEACARHIIEEQMAEQAHWNQRSQYLLDDA